MAWWPTRDPLQERLFQRLGPERFLYVQVPALSRTRPLGVLCLLTNELLSNSSSYLFSCFLSTWIVPTYLQGRSRSCSSIASLCVSWASRCETRNPTDVAMRSWKMRCHGRRQTETIESNFKCYLSSMLLFSVELGNVRGWLGISGATKAEKRWLFEPVRIGRIPLAAWI